MHKPAIPMSKTGPKPRTGRNSRRPETPSRWAGFVPPAEFTVEALHELERIKDALHSRGLLEATDPRMVCMAASLYMLITKAEKEINLSSRLTVSTAAGSTIAHPMIGVLTNATTRLRGLLNDMKLTPKALSAAAQAREDKKEAPSSKWGGILNVSG